MNGKGYEIGNEYGRLTIRLAGERYGAEIQPLPEYFDSDGEIGWLKQSVPIALRVEIARDIAHRWSVFAEALNEKSQK